MERMAGQIFQVSQWCAMNTWTSAIVEDFRHLIKDLKDSQGASKSMFAATKEKDCMFKKKIIIYAANIQNLTHKNEKLEAKLHDSDILNNTLNEVIKEMKLSLTDIHLKVLQSEEKCNHAEVFASEYRRDNENLEFSFNETKCALDYEVEKNATYSRNSEAWKRKCEEEKRCRKMQEQHVQDLKLKLNEALGLQQKEMDHKKKYEQETIIFKEKLLCLNKVILKEKKIYEKTESENQRLNAIINGAGNQSNITQMDTPHLKSPASSWMECPDLGCLQACHSTVLLQGNPIQDMEAQLQDNILCIQRLEDQNRKLLSTLSKLKKMSVKR